MSIQLPISILLDIESIASKDFFSAIIIIYEDLDLHFFFFYCECLKISILEMLFCVDQLISRWVIIFLQH